MGPASALEGAGGRADISVGPVLGHPSEHTANTKGSPVLREGSGVP